VRVLRRWIFLELRQEESTMQNLHIANSDKPVVMYDLNAVISVGYRIRPHHGVVSVLATTLNLLLSPGHKNEISKTSNNHLISAH
jgi:hypothetical protein